MVIENDEAPPWSSIRDGPVAAGTRRRRRGRAARVSGLRFEQSICRILCAYGWQPERTNERTGRIHGRDINLRTKDGDETGICIQCKATKKFSDGAKGLCEARQNHGFRRWICFHSFRQEHRSPLVRILVTDYTDGSHQVFDMTRLQYVLTTTDKLGQAGPSPTPTHPSRSAPSKRQTRTRSMARPFLEKG